MLELKLQDYIRNYTADTTDFSAILKELPKLDMQKGPWLAGGFLVRLVGNESVSKGDIDLFCAHSKQRFATMDKLRQNGYNRPKETFNASSWTKENSLKVQIVHRRYHKSVEDIFLSFDLECCKFATDGYNLVCTEQALYDVQHKIMRAVNRDEYGPVMDPMRYHKYFYRGFVPEKSEDIRIWFDYNADFIQDGSDGLEFKVVEADY